MAIIPRAVSDFFTLNQEQRDAVGEKFLELGNIGAAALIFGRALTEGRLRWFHVTVGVLFWFIMFCIYVLLTKPRGEKWMVQS